MPTVPNLRTNVLLRGEENRIAAQAAGVDPPRWALQSIPEVTIVGPQIAAQRDASGPVSRTSTGTDGVP